MENLDHASSTHERPCVVCRRRKIKCDKSQPCTNCRRAGQLCSYDDIGLQQQTPAGQNGGQGEMAEMRARLEQLERLMADMMSPQDQMTVRSVDGSSGVASDVTNVISVNATAGGLGHSTKLHAGQSVHSSPRHQSGHLFFQDGSCVYFHADFWAGLIAEVEPDELKSLIFCPDVRDPRVPWPSLAPIQYNGSLSWDALIANPTLEQSNRLMRHFFDHVNPFTRVLHTAHFGRLLSQHHRDPSRTPPEARALLFSMYALAISAMDSGSFDGIATSTWLDHFEIGARQALDLCAFTKTNSIFALSALLHYTTLLFKQHRYEDGTAMLANTTQTAVRMGYHRDPDHYPLCNWVRELRRRSWNHLCCLDALAMSSYGIESTLPGHADTEPPWNVDDQHWHASRYATPNKLPRQVDGFTGMTFSLIHRELAGLVHRLFQLDAEDLQSKEDLIAKTEYGLHQKFFRNVDRSEMSQTVTMAFAEDRILTLRLTVRHREAARSRSASTKIAAYTTALDLLEALEYHRTTFATFKWDWIFRLEIPWLALAILLTYTPAGLRQGDIDRSAKMHQTIFEVWSAGPIVDSPMWALLMKLRDRAHLTCGTKGVDPVPQPHPVPAAAADTSISNAPLVSAFQAQYDFMPYDAMMLESDFQEMPWLDVGTQ